MFEKVVIMEDFGMNEMLEMRFCIIYLKSKAGVAFSMAITFGTISYHFLMRLIVGLFINNLMKNRADYKKKWYKCSKWEEGLYKRLNIKK